jgi:hypothetical protein
MVGDDTKAQRPWHASPGRADRAVISNNGRALPTFSHESRGKMEVGVERRTSGGFSLRRLLVFVAFTGFDFPAMCAALVPGARAGKIARKTP